MSTIEIEIIKVAIHIAQEFLNRAYQQKREESVHDDTMRDYWFCTEASITEPTLWWFDKIIFVVNLDNIWNKQTLVRLDALAYMWWVNR